MKAAVMIEPAAGHGVNADHMLTVWKDGPRKYSGIRLLSRLARDKKAITPVPAALITTKHGVSVPPHTRTISVQVMICPA